MAKQRVINTRFWVDPWVQEDLNSMDRFLFLYLLTNDQTNLCGIYEISNHKMCFETGIEKETLIRAMFPRLMPKVYREGNWVIIVNFPRHQNVENPKISLGIQRELGLIPDSVYEKAIGYGYPIHRLSHLTKPNLTKPTDSPTEDGQTKTYEKDSDSEKPVSVGNAFTKKYNELCDWMENLTGTRFVDRRGQFKALKLAREGDISMERLKERAEELWHSGRFEKDGMDWFNVVYSFNKKA